MTGSPTSRRVAITLAAIVLLTGTGLSLVQQKPTAVSVRQAAVAFLGSLDAKQKATVEMDYGSEKRTDWHFIPKAERKGLQIKHMTKDQRKLAYNLLRAALSKSGYDKVRAVMELEEILRVAQGDKKGPIRDSDRYYYSVFGDPNGAGKWGLSIEGHHMSTNFVFEKEEVVSFTPCFFAANPTIVPNDDVKSLKKGTRVLADEELLAFKLVNSLNEEQQKLAVIAEKAPREIRGAGSPQPPSDKPAGIPVSKLTEQQQKTVIDLVKTYLNNLPEDVATAELDKVEGTEAEKIYFAWAGAKKPGVGHYYLIEGPTFQIEFVNTQPDQFGNPASHIHCVLRDPQGDFGLEIRK